MDVLSSYADAHPLALAAAVFGWILLLPILISDIRKALARSTRRIYRPFTLGYDIYVPSTRTWIIGG